MSREDNVEYLDTAEDLEIIANETDSKVTESTMPSTAIGGGGLQVVDNLINSVPDAYQGTVREVLKHSDKLYEKMDPVNADLAVSTGLLLGSALLKYLDVKKGK